MQRKGRKRRRRWMKTKKEKELQTAPGTGRGGGGSGPGSSAWLRTPGTLLVAVVRGLALQPTARGSPGLCSAAGARCRGPGAPPAAPGGSGGGRHSATSIAPEGHPAASGCPLAFRRKLRPRDRSRGSLSQLMAAPEPKFKPVDAGCPLERQSAPRGLQIVGLPSQEDAGSPVSTPPSPGPQDSNAHAEGKDCNP